MTKLERDALECVVQNHLKIMSNRPIFPHPWRRLLSAHWGHYPCRQLIPLPRTYFEVEDIRPGEDELPDIMDKIFVSTSGKISVPKELNQNILQFLMGKDLLRFAMVSKKAEMIVNHCHALMYDAIHEQIEDLLNELNIAPRRKQDQVNKHTFKVGNRFRVHGAFNGYCVRVTPKFVFYVTKPDIFRRHSFIRRVGNDDRVMHVRPYYGVFDDTVQNWRTWLSVTQKLLYSD